MVVGVGVGVGELLGELVLWALHPKPINNAQDNNTLDISEPLILLKQIDDMSEISLSYLEMELPVLGDI